MSKKSIIFLFIITIFLLNINVQAENKMPVEVIFNGDDVIGNRLFYHVKENIRKSKSMKLSNNKEPKYQLCITSIDNSYGNLGNSSALSIVWLQCIMIKNITMRKFINSSVVLCGSNKVYEMAESIIANTDEIINIDLKDGTDPINNTKLLNYPYKLIEDNRKWTENYLKLMKDKNK